MNMVIKQTDYFRGLVKDEKENSTFDWETKMVQGMREKLLKEVKKYVNVFEKKV